MTTDTIVRGKVFVVGDNIDTDQIIPAHYLNLVPTIPEEYAKLGTHAFAGLPHEYPPFVEPGRDKAANTIVVAGRNFGCGSSREHAPIALGAAGVTAVIAESYARIFFRNAVATGELYPCESEQRLCEILRTGEEVTVDIEGGRITRESTGEQFVMKPLGAVAPVVAAGGIFGYARSVGMISNPETEQPKPAPAPAARSTGHISLPHPSGRSIQTKTRVVAIANQKGGVGKTTTVINLATALADAGKRVLIVDLDPQGNSTSGLGLTPGENPSLYQALLGNGQAANLVRETTIKNVHMIPSELDLAGAEVDVARGEGYLHCLAALMEPILESNQYDFILVDCPPSLGILTMNGLTAANGILIPIQCEYYALEGLSVITRILDQLRDSGANPSVHIDGIVMTMYDARTKLSDEVVKEVRKHFGKKVYQTVIPRNVRLSEAPSFGKPVIRYDKSSTGAKAYLKLGKEFLKKLP